MRLYEYELKDMCPGVLPLVLEWRNKLEIRKVMYNSDIITVEQHLNWYDNILKNKSSIPKVLYYKESPIGVVVFNDLTDSHECSWSFYIGNSMNRKGQGLILGFLALEYIFEHFNIINAEVIEFNIPSIKFHEKLGFSLDNVIENGVIKDNFSFDIFKYILTKEKWLAQSSIIKDIITNEMSD